MGRATGAGDIVHLETHFERLLILGHPDGHWSVKSVLNNKGYHVISIGHGKKAYAHRVSYELYTGPIPEDLEVDHTCRTTWCCNPAHLEAVTHSENIRRAYSMCGAKLHDMTDPANYYQRKNGSRLCKPCNNRRNAARFKK